MSDEADIAQVAIEMQLAAARLRRKPTLLAVQRCYNCDADLEGDALFCDRDCRDDYEKRRRTHASR
jgi:hypothetical protein